MCLLQVEREFFEMISAGDDASGVAPGSNESA